MLKILVVDDHPIVRQGIMRIIEETKDMIVAAEAENGSEALEKVKKANFDLILLDISMPDRDGMDIIKELRNSRPNLPILILTIHSETSYAMRMLKLGASGYLTKDKAPNELIEAIRIVSRGGHYISPSIAGALFFDYEMVAGKPLHESLSHREYQVLLKIAEGKSIKSIAHELTLSTKTIHVHRSHILEKMEMRGDADIIHYVIQNKLLE